MKKEEKLKEYYNNPSYCLSCGKTIKYDGIQPLHKAFQRKYCSISCTNKDSKRKVRSSGIYCIHNIKNDKRYIGQSRDMRCRIASHKTALKNNHHENKHLQRAWNKYGKDSFKFEIICECPIELLDNNEIYYIDFYDSYNNGYNNDRGGSANNKMPMPLEVRNKMSLTRLNISEEEKMRNREKNIINHLSESDEIYQVDFNQKIVNIWTSARRAARELNIEQSCIWNCLKKLRKTYKGYIWIYPSEYKSLNVDDYMNFKVKNRNVYCFDLFGVLIRKYSNANDVAKDGYDPSGILKVCKSTHKLKTYKNMLWSFNNHVDEKLIKKLHEKDYIKMYDENNTLIGTYTSQNEIAELYDLTKSGISQCLSGKIKSTKGYYFYYSDTA